MTLAGAFLFCLIMVLFPEVTASASREGVRLWLNAVVPTLFPFLIMANFMKKTGIMGKIPAGLYPFVMAFLSGYPMGAKAAGDYYREGRISGEYLYGILGYSMVTGPAFIIGAIGVAFFDSRLTGYILAVSHYCSALLNGMIFSSRPLEMKNKTVADSVTSAKKQCDDSYYSYLTDSILDSFRTIGIILAYIMMFMIFTDLLQFSGVLTMLPAEEYAAFFKGLMEMTVGCSSVAKCQCSTLVKAVLTSFLISFGGFSILGQSMSMLKKTPVTFWQLFKMKWCHGTISAILTFTIYSFVV